MAQDPDELPREPFAILADLYDHLPEDRDALRSVLTDLNDWIVKGDIAAANRVCRAIKEMIDDAPTKSESAPVRRGGAIPPSAINALLCAVLEVCHWYAQPPPDDLAAMFQRQLGLGGRGARASRAPAERTKAAAYAGRVLHDEARWPRVSGLARQVGISKSTAREWLSQELFFVEAKFYYGFPQPPERSD